MNDGRPYNECPSKLHTPENGVLLYYKYVHLGEDRRLAVKEWYEHVCEMENLRGRIRVALDGVNCTLGGDLAALQRHIISVRTHSTIQGQDIDFKLSVSHGPRNSQAAAESGFTTLSVKAVKEVVSMGTRGADFSPRQSAKHISPQEFHRILRRESERQQSRRQHSQQALSISTECSRGDLQEGPGQGRAHVLSVKKDARTSTACSRGDTRTGAGSQATKNWSANGRSPDSIALAHTACSSGETVERGENVVRRQADEGATSGGAVSSGGCDEDSFRRPEEKDTVLLDVRNVYETSIGHFSVDGVKRLDPKTRQFSDLPAWVDDNIGLLRGKRVLMYCTGGVRCEKASALLRKRCDDATSSTCTTDADTKDDTEILQLAGGIERYLQAYPRSQGRMFNNDGQREDGGTPSFTTQNTQAQETGGVDDIHDDLARKSLISGEHEGMRMKNEGREENVEGFFRGKNFVFDERVSVPESPAGGVIIGRCIICRLPWDDYGSRSRCSRCRMLVLVCDSCVEADDSGRRVLSPGLELPPTDSSSANTALPVSVCSSAKAVSPACVHVAAAVVDDLVSPVNNWGPESPTRARASPTPPETPLTSTISIPTTASTPVESANGEAQIQHVLSKPERSRSSEFDAQRTGSPRSDVADVVHDSRSNSRRSKCLELPAGAVKTACLDCREGSTKLIPREYAVAIAGNGPNRLSHAPPSSRELVCSSCAEKASIYRR